MIDVESYLQRIAYAGSREPALETLHALHVAHLLAVPFENLDIHWRRPIVLDDAALFDKVVRRRRGGFCYELNGLFAALLRALGFRVTLIAAAVARDEGGFGPAFDHLALLVALDERWLVDVGFGDSFRRPLRLDTTEMQRDAGQTYRIAADGASRTLLRSEGGGWTAQYRFTLQPRELGDYAAMCRYHQTSPLSPFTRRRTCSLATPDGRITLTDGRLIVTSGAERAERPIATEDEYAAALREHFGLAG